MLDSDVPATWAGRTRLPSSSSGMFGEMKMVTGSVARSCPDLLAHLTRDTHTDTHTHVGKERGDVIPRICDRPDS